MLDEAMIRRCEAMADLIHKIPGVVTTRVGYSGGDVANATYRNHGTHAEAIVRSDHHCGRTWDADDNLTGPTPAPRCNSRPCSGREPRDREQAKAHLPRTAGSLVPRSPRSRRPRRRKDRSPRSGRRPG